MIDVCYLIDRAMIDVCYLIDRAMGICYCPDTTWTLAPNGDVCVKYVETNMTFMDAKVK